MNWTDNEFIIYGCGLAGRWTYEYVTQAGGKVTAFIDSDSKKHGTGYAGVEIFGPDKLEN